MTLMDRIELDPRVCNGKPVIKGTRIPVSIILEQIAERESWNSLLAGYPELNKEDIQAAVIGTPNKFHAPYAIELMQNGIDVFVEKPMAVTASQGAEMIECARKNERIRSFLRLEKQ